MTIPEALIIDILKVAILYIALSSLSERMHHHHHQVHIQLKERVHSPSSLNMEIHGKRSMHHHDDLTSSYWNRFSSLQLQSE